MNERRNTQIEKQENLTYERFRNQFKNYIKNIVQTDITSCFDAAFTASTKTVFNIEFKERNYSCEYLSGSTWIEENKYQDLKNLWRTNKEIQFIYFNYTTDGYISYNLNQRFRTQQKKLFVDTNNCTYCPSYNKHKTMISLCFNPETDKLIQY